MLIVARQNIEKYMIYNTVTDDFLGVNLKYEDAVDKIANYKGISVDDACERVEHPEPVCHIFKHLGIDTDNLCWKCKRND
jgi:hypothetical protein